MAGSCFYIALTITEEKEISDAIKTNELCWLYMIGPCTHTILNNNNISHYGILTQVPSMNQPSTFHVLIQWILKLTLWSRYPFYPNFTDGETKTHRSNLSQITNHIASKWQSQGVDHLWYHFSVNTHLNISKWTGHHMITSGFVDPYAL